MVAVTNLQAGGPSARLDLGAIKQAHSLHQVATRGLTLRSANRAHHTESLEQFKTFSNSAVKRECVIARSCRTSNRNLISERPRDGY